MGKQTLVVPRAVPANRSLTKTQPRSQLLLPVLGEGGAPPLCRGLLWPNVPVHAPLPFLFSVAPTPCPNENGAPVKGHRGPGRPAPDLGDGVLTCINAGQGEGGRGR